MIISKLRLRQIVKEEIQGLLESTELELRTDDELSAEAEDAGLEELIVYAEIGILDDDSRERIIAALTNDA
tara:strand:+ start:4978 stop:5190 length:213 start_codon:yes stop_codon:yes gene_type:complete